MPHATCQTGGNHMCEGKTFTRDSPRCKIIGPRDNVPNAPGRTVLPVNVVQNLVYFNLSRDFFNAQRDFFKGDDHGGFHIG